MTLNCLDHVRFGLLLCLLFGCKSAGNSTSTNFNFGCHNELLSGFALQRIGSKLAAFSSSNDFVRVPLVEFITRFLRLTDHPMRRFSLVTGITQ